MPFFGQDVVVRDSHFGNFTGVVATEFAYDGCYLVVTHYTNMSYWISEENIFQDI